MTTPTTSNQFSVKGIDILKGLLVAVITPVFTILLTSLDAGSLVFDWKVIGTVALSAALSYIMKNFLSPPRIVITDPATVERVKDGEATVKVVEKK